MPVIVGKSITTIPKISMCLARATDVTKRVTEVDWELLSELHEIEELKPALLLWFDCRNTGEQVTGDSPNAGQPVRFFDSREKYLLFVTTTDEKWSIAQRINEELDKLEPKPPALRMFDAGMGDASVLSHVLRAMHDRYPDCLLYTSPSPRDGLLSRMPSSA